MELLEIETELKGPARMEALQRYDGMLVDLGARLDAALAEGLPPEEFARCEGLGEAVVLARKLLRLQVRDGEGPSSRERI